MRVLHSRFLPPQVRLSGLREVHFGSLFRDEPPAGEAALWARRHLARFAESFQYGPSVEGSEPLVSEELWVAFSYEGSSLARLLYDAGSPVGMGGGGGLRLVEPSAWWRGLKGSAAGRAVLQDCLRQMLLALAAVHAAGVAHRDVKVS